MSNLTDMERKPNETQDAWHTRMLAHAYGIGKKTVAETAECSRDVALEIDVDRQTVEAIDIDILRLVATRMKVTRRIGANKNLLGMAPVIEKVRNNKVEKAMTLGPAIGLNADLAAQVQTMLIEASEAEQIAASAAQGPAAFAPEFREAAMPEQLNGYMR